MVDRLFAGHDWLEAILVGGDPARLAARDGAVAAVADPAPGPSLWGTDVEPPPVDDWTTAVARGLASVALTNATTKRADLVAQVDRDGGADAIAAEVAMLAIDAPRAVLVASVHFAAGHPEGAAALSDAIGALGVFAPPAGASGVTLPVGPAKGGDTTVRMTQVTLNPAGLGVGFRLDGHAWVIDRDAAGAVTGMRRDGTRLAQGGAR